MILSLKKLRDRIKTHKGNTNKNQSIIVGSFYGARQEMHTVWFQGRSRLAGSIARALSELLASPFKYYNPIHGEKVLEILIDKLGVRKRKAKRAVISS